MSSTRVAREVEVLLRPTVAPLDPTPPGWTYAYEFNGPFEVTFFAPDGNSILVFEDEHEMYRRVNGDMEPYPEDVFGEDEWFEVIDPWIVDVYSALASYAYSIQVAALEAFRAPINNMMLCTTSREEPAI